jgi:hypothetical protein
VSVVIDPFTGVNGKLVGEKTPLPEWAGVFCFVHFGRPALRFFSFTDSANG